MQDRTRDIIDTRRKLQELEAEQARFEAQPADRRLAVLLHDALCPVDHNEGCAWYYDMENKQPKFSREGTVKWLRYATALLKREPGRSPEQIADEIIHQIQGMWQFAKTLPENPFNYSGAYRNKPRALQDVK